MDILLAILAIGVLIIVHESGHYFVARWSKMRVERFSLGFGPPLLKWRRGETDFTLGPIPFGGFVQINGMMAADEVDPDDDRAYPNRPVWQRFLTIFAGPATNYLAAVAIAIPLYLAAGVDHTGRWTVTSVSPDFDAHGKLETGDVITAIDGVPVFAKQDGRPVEKQLSDYVQESHSGQLEVGFERAGTAGTVTISTKPATSGDAARVCRQLMGWQNCDEKRIGIGQRPDLVREEVSTLGALGWAAMYPINKSREILGGLYDVITGRAEGRLTGPVGITNAIKEAIQLGWIRALEFLMLLNVMLGLFNLLPLPALDGGRLVFLGYEMATRKRANPRIEATVHMVGIMALLLVMVLVTYQDIANLPLFK